MCSNYTSLTFYGNCGAEVEQPTSDWMVTGLFPGSVWPTCVSKSWDTEPLIDTGGYRLAALLPSVLNMCVCSRLWVGEWDCDFTELWALMKAQRAISVLAIYHLLKPQIILRI